MPLNTIDINRQQGHFNDRAQLWLFGYGSLIFKVDFPVQDCRPAYIHNWSRRFWQGSHDHRGTLDAPGRVATLIREPGACCVGMAYMITPAVFDHLDMREKNGYLRFSTPLTFTDGRAPDQAEGLVYIATEDNAAFLCPAPEADIARHIAGAQGPSGPNRDYLLNLADALRALNAEDPHVFAIEQLLHEAHSTR